MKLACLDTLQKLTGDCSTLGFRNGEKEAAIFAVQNFKWSDDVTVPGTDPATTVTIGAYTDVASWQTALDNDLIMVVNGAISDNDPTQDTVYVCGVDEVSQTTFSFGIQVNKLPTDGYGDYDSFCKLNQLIGKGGVRLIGFKFCDGTVEFLDKSHLGGRASGSFNKIAKTEDQSNESWNGDVTVRMAGVPCLTRESLPDIAEIL